MGHTKSEIMAGMACVSARVIRNNTVEYERENGDRVIRLHFTDIITFHKDGSITLNSGGWRTVTTKERMNSFSPIRIIQKKHIWYVMQSPYIWKHKDKWIPFADNMRIFSDGCVTGAGEDPRKLLKLQRQIDKYVKGYMRALTNRELDKPGAGDCFGCLFVDSEGKKQNPMGTDHLLSHMNENHQGGHYYVPSLIFRALEAFPVGPTAKHCIGYWFKMHEDDPAGSYAEEQVAKSLKRYLYMSLGMAA